MTRSVPVLVLLLLFWADTASAQNTIDIDAIRASKRIQAVRTNQPIRPDNVLDEPAWGAGARCDGFLPAAARGVRARHPPHGSRFIYNDEMLYVGAMLDEPEPDRLITNELKRDFCGSSGDGFGPLIDTRSRIAGAPTASSPIPAARRANSRPKATRDTAS